MEMAYEISHSMFKVASIFSLVSIRHGDVLAPGSPFKERDTWKEKVRAIEIRCTNIQKALLVLYEEVKASHSFQNLVKIHGSPSTLASRVTKLRVCSKK